MADKVSARQLWQVWSQDNVSGNWMVIDEGTKRHCLDGVERRQANAKQYGIENAKYQAQPFDAEPVDD